MASSTELVMSQQNSLASPNDKDSQNMLSKQTTISLRAIESNASTASQDQQEGIISNLSSLRFDSGISGRERELLFLRKRSQMITVNHVAHAVFTVSILSEIRRQLYIQQNPPSNDKEIKKMKQQKVGRIKVGVIGCGRLGIHLVKSLLEYTPLMSEDIKLSTKRPGALVEDFTSLGVECKQDNKYAASEVDVLFFTFPPNQIVKVATEIKGHLSPGCLVYTVLTGLSASRIAGLIEHDLVYKPCYVYCKEEYAIEKEWSYGLSIVGCLAINDFKQLTIPLVPLEDLAARVIQVDRTLIQCVFIQALNLCHTYANKFLGINERYKLANHILFRGETGYAHDFLKQIKLPLNKEGYFKITEMLKNGEHRPLKLTDDSRKFCTLFAKHYKLIFDRWLDWTEFSKD
eukprot:TCONS_00067798-protein